MAAKALIFISALVITAGQIFGEGPMVIGTGYSAPGSIRISPGQITTFFVTGLGATQPVQASGLPLPSRLAGISLTINQFSPKQSLSVPLLAITQTDLCSQPQLAPDCLMTMVTAQIPFELVPAPLGANPYAAEVVVTSDGASGRAFSLQVVTDVLHVLTTCDEGSPGYSRTSPRGEGKCNSIVTHSDGSLVTADSPATEGEVIVIYAYGLGQTLPAVKSGLATPAPAPVLAYNSGTPYSLIAQFDFRPNAGLSRPYFDTFEGGPRPTFNGLTPGEVGLYQINIKLPDVFPPTPPCNLIKSPQLLDLAFSNLTINIQNNTSMDAASICVKASK